MRHLLNLLPRPPQPRRLLSPLLLPILVLALLGAATLSVSGCQVPPATPGTPAPTALQTFDALYANAVTAEDLVIKTTTSTLQSGLISSAQAKKVMSITDSIKMTLDVAYGAAQTGNTGVATGNLAQALGPLAVLSACLTTKPLTIQTFDACTVKLTPPAVQS
jgi:hypothetical protein